MTPEELAEVEERCRKATPAPWTKGPTTYHLADGDGVLLAEFDDSRANYDADLAFVREARADVPALVAEVRKLMEERDQAVHAAQANTAELARAWEERDAALAQTYRLREALDAAQRIVKRKADREAGREET